MAHTEKKGFVTASQARLTRLEKREKALTAIVEKQASIAKTQKNSDFFKTAREKVKKQKESDLTTKQE